MKMTLRKVFGVLTILCLLTLTGAAIPASAAQETSQPAPEIEMADPTAVRLAIGDRARVRVADGYHGDHRKV